jgi:hypothetical protein
VKKKSQHLDRQMNAFDEQRLKGVEEEIKTA